MTTSPKKRRRSLRGNSSLEILAELITSSTDSKLIIFITGAGLSVSSGIRPFRGQDNGLWAETLWTQATRKHFRKNPLKFYNDFWLKYFPSSEYDEQEYRPSAGHEAIAQLANLCERIRVVTQNVDGLHSRTRTKWDTANNLVEVHGRVGLFKCIPEEDSDTDSDEDEEDERAVKLGSRRKKIAHLKSFDHHSRRKPCVYECIKSIPLDQLEPALVRETLSLPSHIDKFKYLKAIPTCPACHRPAAPQALLFDEGYHSHSHYNFEFIENWLSSAAAIVFVGTSFSVTITDVALQHARGCGIPVYNFNIGERLEPTSKLLAENILGPSDDTLPKLVETCREILRKKLMKGC